MSIPCGLATIRLMVIPFDGKKQGSYVASLWQLRVHQFWNLAAASSLFALVLSTGPQVQTYLFALLNSEVPTVYGAVHQQTLTQFPPLSSWISEAIKWPVVAMGVFVGWVSTTNREPRVVLWKTLWSSAVVLSVFDTVGAILWHGFTTKWFVENLVANVLGGVVIAALVVGIFSAADFAYRFLPVGTIARNALSPAVVVLAGLLYCCTTYYISGIFFELLPTRFDITMSAPSSGAAAPIRPSSVAVFQDHDRPFSFSISDPVDASVQWISPHGNTAVRTAFVGDELPKVELRAFAGCVDASQIQKAAAGTQAWISTSDVSSFEIVSDTGPTDFATAMPSKTRSSVKIDGGPMTMFSIDEEPSTQTLKITQFVDETAAVEMRSRQTSQFFFGLPLMSGDEKKKLALKPRMLTVRIGSRTQFIRFWPPKSAHNLPEVSGCRFLTDLRAVPDHDDQTDIDTQDFLISVLVTINRPVDARTMSTDHVPMRITSSGGWITLGDLRAADLRTAPLGRLSMLQARGNVSELLLDDVAQTSRQVETYTATGDLQAQFSHGKLRVFGIAKRLWKDQSRLNATKWEKLGWEPKTAVLAMLVSIFGVLGAAIGRRLRSNQKYDWLR